MQPQGNTTQAAAGPTKEDAPPPRATPLPMTNITPTLALPPGQLQHVILLIVTLQLRARILCHLERRAVIVALATAPIYLILERSLAPLISMRSPTVQLPLLEPIAQTVPSVAPQLTQAAVEVVLFSLFAAVAAVRSPHVHDGSHGDWYGCSAVPWCLW